MKREVVLSLRGTQTYIGQEPEEIELITDGVLAETETGWEIGYAESALTGLEGVYTTFLLEDGCVTLTRTGALESQMVFRQGVSHESLYQMDFGALLITVCATQISWNVSPSGGTVDLKYTIDIENAAAGTVDYHLQIKSKEL